MDTSARFFSKLRSLAMLLDTERANLEQTASQNLDQDDEDAESSAVQALHELHSEIREMKKEVQSQVVSQESLSTDLRSFIKSCMVLKQRTTEDIERLQRHFGKYGYKPQKDSLKLEGRCNSVEHVRSADEPEREPSEETTAAKEKLDNVPEVETPEMLLLPAVDPTRTPQLSDYGLSALHLQMVLGNSEMTKEAAPVLADALTPPLQFMAMHESQPKTPKCSLIMDEEALTPQLENFGITESTLCFNNDFTLDLFRKKPPKDRQINSKAQDNDQIAPHSLPTAPSCVPLGRLSSDSMDSPEVPVFSTLEIKMNKQLGQPCSLPIGVTDPDSPAQPSAASATPEVPNFETPYVSKLISARKETKQNEEDDHTGSMSGTSCFTKGPSVRVPSSEMPASLPQTEETTPEMPRLQSFFSSTLPRIGAGNRSAVSEPPVPPLQADEHTQDWCLATPRIRMEFDVEPRTPEMPDMSSITQDIFKLVAQANNKPPFTTTVQASAKASLNMPAPGKENRSQSVDQVSEKDFNGLASYMKQIPLTSLNLALKKINQTLEKRHTDGERTPEEFHMEDLRRILDVGPQAPMYILCLVELKRIENVQGFGRNATFKVITKA